MKRLVLFAIVGALCAFANPAVAGDWHSGANLICADCHLMHGSQEHAYAPGGLFVTVGAEAPYKHLLRNEVNDLCLTCHDNQSFAPDVFGANGGVAMNRRAGGLNADPAHRANDTGYETMDGHTLWSTDVAPGGTFTQAEGLECTSCHSQHGQNLDQYRNLRRSSSGAFGGKVVSYATGTNDPTKDVFQRVLRGYSDADIDYNEPSTTGSAMGAWCMSCHTTFHGAGGSANMGGASGGDPATGAATAWHRHPTADVNIGWAASRPHYSSLSQFNSHTNRVKVMDSQGLWDGTAADNTVTPSCFSCHKSHGDKNGFALIYMAGTGDVTEEGDTGTQPKDLCKQCHVQG